MPPTFLKGSDSVVARLVKLNYTEDMYALNVMLMYYLAFIFRVIAYGGLVGFNRDKRSLPSFFDMIVEDSACFPRTMPAPVANTLLTPPPAPRSLRSAQGPRR